MQAAAVKTVVATILVLMLSGCNTMKGLGQDMQKAGSAIERSVK